MQLVRDTLAVGSVISGGNRDRYIVESILVRHSFSTIYIVRDQRVRQNLYALKEVREIDRREVRHLALEYEILTLIEHPSLPRVYRVFEDAKNNRVYVLMDYIEGSDLEQRRKQYFVQRLGYRDVLSIMAPIVEAISFLHHQEPPIVHRDIKPSNIIVPESGEKAYLIDFGIAKLYEAEETLTSDHKYTPGYGAPEQYDAGVTPRTDIYGLGATFYTLLTGKLPVDALKRLRQFNVDGSDPLVPIHQIVSTVPQSIALAVHRAMSLQPEQRFATIEEFWSALHTERELETIANPAVQSSFNTLKQLDQAEKSRQTRQVFGSVEESSGHVANAPVPLLLVILCTAVLSGLYWRSLSHHSPVQSVRQVAPTSTARNSQQITTVYPLIVEQYKGTISDVVANSTTAMALSSIQQQATTIRGNFVGLGLSGPLTGSITTGGHIQFQVMIYGNSETLVFEGNIKLGGSMAGSYRILNSNHEFTGEYGLWSVSPL